MVPLVGTIAEAAIICTNPGSIQPIGAKPSTWRSRFLSNATKVDCELTPECSSAVVIKRNVSSHH
jgi:hypothetical protein